MVVLIALLMIRDAAGASRQTPLSWFQQTEQALMDAIAAGNPDPWQRAMDERCVLTTEEGEVRSREEFLKELRPLPPGLTGGITVKDLTVDEYPALAVVRFLADEWETVFGQRLTTAYRVTDTYRRSDSSWKMVASHVSVVTRDPAGQRVATDGWPGLVGTYQLLPDGWKFHVVLREGQLYGGRDLTGLKRLIPMTPTAFVREGSLGEWLFVVGPEGKGTAIVNLRKFEPLVWTRVADQ
jgi:hypothetical protein